MKLLCGGLRNNSKSESDPTVRGQPTDDL